MSVINAVPLLAAAGGDYQISRSVRLRSSASAYFNRTLTNNGNSTKWTFGVWLKRGRLGVDQTIFGSSSGTSTNFAQLKFDSSDRLDYTEYTTSIVANRITSAVYRDPSAYYNIVFCYDSGNATASDRLKLYVNGVEVTAFSSSTNPSLNATSFINYVTGNVNNIGRLVFSGAGANYFDGYLTEINFIDGQALTPSSFGENDTITGVWKPKKYAGTYGTNGFYLNFSDNSNNTAATIGKDYSGNGNNWTPNNISVTSGVTYDSMIDVPTPYADGGNGRGNYSVLNPLDRNGTYGSVTDGNLTQSVSTANHAVVFNSMAMPSGKTYLEVTSGTTTSATPLLIAFGLATQSASRTGYGNTNTWSIKCIDVRTLWNGASSSSNFGSAFTSGTTLQLAYDSATGYMWIGDGTNWYNSTGGTTGNPSAGTNPSFTISTTESLFFFMDCYAGSGTVTAYANFGQRPFTYTPPTGFKAPNTQNLPDSTIKRGGSYFNSVLYTGNAGNQSITGVGFQPDLVWGKLRSTSGNHRLHDSLRGSDNTLSSNLTDAEVSGNGLVSFDADGFTMDSGTNINQAYTYVAWNWKESATAGFDIVTYTGNGTAGRTISHSLGVAPSMMIVKSRSSGTEPWRVYHKNMAASPATVYMNLSDTGASVVSSTRWNDTAPTSSVFTVGSDSSVNASGATYVAYLFSEVAGFSKFGSYTGNGSADGPFVFLGFRPRFIMTKRTDSTSDWHILDTSRNTYNVAGSALFPNSSSSETTNGWYDRDFLSNGFKIRASVTEVNASGGTYIYAAFAENPFKLSLAR